MIRAVAIDLDGTLVRGTTTCRHLADRLGHTEAMDQLERDYAAGTITNATIADWVNRNFAGKTPAELHALLRSAPVIDGIQETIDALHREGLAIFLATITSSIFADYFADTYGFDERSGGREALGADGRLTGMVERYFNEHDKVNWVETQCRQRGIGIKECAAVGDSRSDVPLFGRVGFSIALNGTPEARAAATVTVDADTLTAILPHLKCRLAGPRASDAEN
jgi:phosphoserine phosphatase